MSRPFRKKPCRAQELADGRREWRQERVWLSVATPVRDEEDLMEPKLPATDARVRSDEAMNSRYGLSTSSGCPLCTTMSWHQWRLRLKEEGFDVVNARIVGGVSACKLSVQDHDVDLGSEVSLMPCVDMSSSRMR